MNQNGKTRIHPCADKYLPVSFSRSLPVLHERVDGKLAGSCQELLAETFHFPTAAGFD